MQALVCLVLLTGLACSPSFAQPQPLVDWVRCYGDSCQQLQALDDQLLSFEPTRDGGFILVGYTGRFLPAGNLQMLLVRTDSLGQLLWEQPYGGQVGMDAGWEVAQTADGGFVVGGHTSGDLTQGGNGSQVLWKVDSLGSLLWRRQDYGDSTGAAYAMAATSDGGFVLAGVETRGNPGNTDVCLTRTDSQGNLLWQRRYDAGGQETALAIINTRDGGFLVTGQHFTADNGNSALLVLRADGQGNPLWQRLYLDAWDHPGVAIHEEADGSIYVLGTTSYYLTYNLLHKLDSQGQQLWQRRIETPDSAVILGDLVRVPDGFAVTGSSGETAIAVRDVYVGRVNLEGEVLWHRTVHLRDHNIAEAIRLLPSGAYAVAGTVQCQYGISLDGTDFFLLRTGTDALPVAEPPLLQPQAFRLTASPNPFNPQTTLRFTLPQAGPATLAVYDLAGRQVAVLLDAMLTAGEHALPFDGSALPTGIYFARLSTRTVHTVQKLVLLK